MFLRVRAFLGLTEVSAVAERDPVKLFERPRDAMPMSPRVSRNAPYRKYQALTYSTNSGLHWEL